VKTRFQNLPFKCNLQRYTADDTELPFYLSGESRELGDNYPVGRV
jgi:hypothetical protein